VLGRVDGSTEQVVDVFPMHKRGAIRPRPVLDTHRPKRADLRGALFLSSDLDQFFTCASYCHGNGLWSENFHDPPRRQLQGAFAFLDSEVERDGYAAAF
jgi:hypothetical protein